jgi:hypothetical protein
MKINSPALLCAAALTLGATASAPAKEKKATAAGTPEASGSPITKARRFRITEKSLRSISAPKRS